MILTTNDLLIEDPKEYPITDDPKEDPFNDKKSSKIGRTSYSRKVTVKKIKAIRKICY